MKKLALIFTLAILASALAIPAAFAADTTDLNNIPITDTLEEGTFEWDVNARYNEDFPRGRRVNTRLFGALFDNFEFGMSWGISRLAGPVEMAVKYKVLDEYGGGGICGSGGGFPVSLAIGAEGITGNWQRTNYDPTYYAVVGLHDVRFLAGWWDWYVGMAHNPFPRFAVGEVHPGYAYDAAEDNSLFGGFKYWIDEDWQFNADYMGYDSNEYYIAAAGFNYDWVKHIGFQGWVERDSYSEDNYFILELSVRADMRDLTCDVSDPE